MKLVLAVTITLCLINYCYAVCLDTSISTHPDGFATAKDSGNYHDACMAAVKGQIKMEFQASMSYTCGLVKELTRIGGTVDIGPN